MRANGHVFAFALSCPHQNAAVKWVPQHNQFECTKHDSHYTADGTHVSGRATRNMDRMPIRKDGNMVHVDTAHVFQSDKDAAGWNARNGAPYDAPPCLLYLAPGWRRVRRRVSVRQQHRYRRQHVLAVPLDAHVPTSPTPPTTIRERRRRRCPARRPDLHDRYRADHERRLRPVPRTVRARTRLRSLDLRGRDEGGHRRQRQLEAGARDAAERASCTARFPGIAPQKAQTIYNWVVTSKAQQ